MATPASCISTTASCGRSQPVDVGEGSQVALDQTAFDVGSTDEIARVRVVKAESKGKDSKRVRLEVVDSSP